MLASATADDGLVLLLGISVVMCKAPAANGAAAGLLLALNLLPIVSRLSARQPPRRPKRSNYGAPGRN